jgi:perosamine synthetase
MTTDRIIPLSVPNLEGNEAVYLQECISSTFVSSVGPFVDQFESLVASASGADYAVATSSGTTGLHAALVAVGVGRDDLVITPTFTFIATANAIDMAGATPWLFDVTSENWTLDPDLMARMLDTETDDRDGKVIHRKTGRRVAAIMPVHVLGMPTDIDAIEAIATSRRLPIVVDAAAALGATYKGRPIAQKGASLSVFSFNGNKTVTCGGGGAIVGNNAELIDLVRHLTTTARVGADYHHDRVGYNYRMTNLQAAVGCAQMERLDQFVEAKRRIAKGYDDALVSPPAVTAFPSPEWAESACWISGIVLDKKACDAPSDIREKLRVLGVDARPFWKPLHLQPPYSGSPRTATPVSDGLWDSILTLPCSSGLSPSDQDFVIARVRETLD